ncbi:hypothetical protein PENSPDRAFT_567066, partial [Peniophora sp. CONT]
FPPAPAGDDLKRDVIRDFCDEMKPSKLREEGCAVCGTLSKSSDMTELSAELFDHALLEDPTGFMTRRERHRTSDLRRPLHGPVLDRNCSKVCKACLRPLSKGKIPDLALVNGNWIGEVPRELRGLTLLEQMLIARVRHNACVLKVHASGQYKLRANAVMFAVPTPKLY